MGVGSLLFMLRIIAARNGTIEPSVALKIDTLGDAATARRAFIDEASLKLQVETTAPYRRTRVWASF